MKARQPLTWWRRVSTVVLATGVLMVGYLGAGMYSSPSRIGRELFSILSGLGVVGALLSGPFTTADCLGRERREGTLGLLFLTNLRSYDVVFGKMAGASLDMLLVAAAVFPVLSIPLLLGGITFTEFGYIGLALLNIMVLSLAVGVFCSALFAGSRASLASSLIILSTLSLGLPLLGENILRVHLHDKVAPFFYALCPIYTMEQCLNWSPKPLTWKFWLNMASMHGLAWLCILLACARTRNSWRDLPVSGWQQRLQARWESWKKGGSSYRLAWRRAMLERTPFAWLEGRDQLEHRILWGILLIATVLWFWKFRASRYWPTDDVAILWPLFAHYILCVWIAIRMPHRLAEDKQSGALELLLCTPLPPAEVVRGSLLIWWKRFGAAALALILLGLYGVFLYFIRHGVQDFARNDVFKLTFCGLFVLPIQAYSFARVGLYQGLAQSNSLKATFLVIAQLGILPWIVFIGLVLSCELSQRYLGVRLRLTDAVAFGTWAATHVMICVLFLAHANRQLWRNFRVLAAQPTPPPWWKRWLPTRIKERY